MASFNPAITFWHRLEPRSRSNDLANALAARVRDPAWFLTRQWQLGEFAGEDAGSPAYMKVAANLSAIGSWSTEAGTGVTATTSATAPLEKDVLLEPFSPIDVGTSVELGQRFERHLAATSLSAVDRATVITAYRGTYAIGASSGDDATSARFRALWKGRATDGIALYTAAKAASPSLPPPTLDPSLQAQTLVAVNAFLASVAADYGSFGTSDPSCWKPERIEYGVHAFARRPVLPDTNSIQQLAAIPDRDGDLDWYAFDASSASTGGATAPPVTTKSLTVVPAPMRFRGMPNARFWDFEDGTVDFGNVIPDKKDLATLILMDFMLVHGNDWFVIPFTIPAGSLCASTITVTDVFGVVHTISSANTAGGSRWSMFSTLDVEDTNYGAFSIFPATVAAAVQDSPALEEVKFLRDETANLAWAVERVTESHLGRPMPGADRGAPVPVIAPTELTLSYRLQTYVPYNWIPFQAVAVQGGAPGEIALQRSRLLDPAATPGGPPITPTPFGKILLPSSLSGHPYLLREEEVTREGARVARVVRLSRWLDGSTHLWVARKRSVGTGEGYSGLRYDLALNTTPQTVVVSATVEDANKNQLVVVFSKAVNVSDVTGLSLSFTVGGAGQTITSVISGSGSTTVIFGLSAPLAMADALSFVYGSTNKIVDVDAVALAAWSKPVVNHITDLNTISGLKAWYWSPDSSKTTLVAGPKVSVWGDKAAAPHDASQSTDAKRPGYTATNPAINNQPSLDFAGGQRLDLTANLDLSGTPAVEIFAVVTSTDTIAVSLLEFGSSLASDEFNISRNSYDKISAGLYGNVGFTIRASALHDATSWSALNARFDKSARDAAEVDFYIGPYRAEDPVVSSDNTGNFGAEKLYLGADGLFAAPMTGGYAAFILFGRILSTAERAAVFALLKTTFNVAVPAP